ncbi:MAG: glycosidase [Phycisphaerae bacterium]
MQIKRHPENPVVTPGGHDWRCVTVFNPAVLLDDDGRFYMWERATQSLEPLQCSVGLLGSDDGVHWQLERDRPVLSVEDFGTPRGTVEDPRVVKIDGQYIMTFVHRNYTWICRPTGVGIPLYVCPEGIPADDLNNYRSGVAVSTDRENWNVLGLITPEDLDDRDCVIFPEKIGGRYAMLRRPMNYVGPEFGTDAPSMWISYSEDLLNWSDAELVAVPENDWEGGKIGAAAPPMLTDEGWLTLYHGVDENVTYRVGVMLLDRHDPTKMLARCPDFIMEPQAYYERTGLIIPNVIFPTANVVKDGTVHIYYGCTDTCISLATVELADLLGLVLKHPR